MVVNNDPTYDSIQGNLYFNVAKADWDKLPRILGDERIVWFVFSNKLADHAFKQSGPVTITIDNYVIDSMESAVANTAKAGQSEQAIVLTFITSPCHKFLLIQAGMFVKERSE